MLKTTAGKLIVADALPDDMKDWAELSFNKKTLSAFMTELAQRHPDQYREVTHKLLQIARRGAMESGSNSFGLKHIRVSPIAKARREKLHSIIDKINEDDSLSDEERNNKLIKAIADSKKGFEDELMAEAKAEGSPLERMISSGARGNPGSLASLRGGDFQYVDSEGRGLPVPILKSYGEGLDPVSYWAGSFGARQGLLSAKFSTAESGYFAKRLQQAAHRLLVTGVDEDGEEDGVIRGMPADSGDPHNEGSLLAHPAGGYQKNTILTPKILQDLKRQNIGRILVRSPIVGGARDGGLLARDVGIRETGDLPHPGSLVGLLAAQSIAERLSQQALGAKHLGGIAGKGVEQLTQGFPLVEQLVDIPSAFKGGATHSQTDGQVQLVHEAPAGGTYVTIDGQDHYVPMGHQVLVNKGDTIEAGDMLSSGIPNPSEIVKHKGVGEGRRYYTHQLAQVLKGAGVNAHRRNVELIARAMIDHVRMNEEAGDWLPGDVVSYQSLERGWTPREGHEEAEPKQAVGKYLERPVLHYTIGTKVRPSMMKDFDEFGVKSLTVHKDPPPFEPEMVRSQDSLHHDPDWITKMYGSGLKKNLLKDIHSGAGSDEKSTSFVPSLAKGINFGLMQPFDKLNQKMGADFFTGTAGPILAQMGVDHVLDKYTSAQPAEWATQPGDDWAASRLFHEGLGPGSSEDTAALDNYFLRNFGISGITCPLTLGSSMAVGEVQSRLMEPYIQKHRQNDYANQYNDLSKLNGERQPLPPTQEQTALSVLQREPEAQRRFHAAEMLADKYMDQHRQHFAGLGTNRDFWGGNNGGAYSVQQAFQHKQRPALEEYAQTGNAQKLQQDLQKIHSELAYQTGNGAFNLNPLAPEDMDQLAVNSGFGIPGGPGALKEQEQAAIARDTDLKYQNVDTEQLKRMSLLAPADHDMAAAIGRRQQAAQRATQRAEQQQKIEMDRVMQANPADPYLRGQQMAAQMTLDNPALGGNAYDEMAARQKAHEQFLAQHQFKQPTPVAASKPAPSAMQLGQQAGKNMTPPKPPVAEPPKMPTPPKMPGSLPTAKLPLVPGGSA